MISNISFHAFMDELCKIAGLPPPLPAAAKSMAGTVAKKVLPKAKQYGQEGFNALMEGTKAHMQSGGNNPFAAMVH